MVGALFGATSTSLQGAMDIIKATSALPVLRSPSVGAGMLAWGVGAAQWVAVDDQAEGDDTATPTTTPTVEMRKELRVLVAASFDVYMRLHRLHNSKARAQRELEPVEIVRASRDYRNALHSCIFAIEDQSTARASSTMDTTDTGDANEEEELVDVLQVSLAIWHLCELLFLQRRPRDDHLLAYDLAAWLQEHYYAARADELERTTQRLRAMGSDGGEAADRDEAFWPTIYGLVMMGHGSHAWSLLALHSSYRALFTRESVSAASTRESFQSIQRLLLCMPGGGMGAGMQRSPPIEWQNWRDACQYVLNTDGFVRGHDELRTLMQLMTADVPTLQSHATTWYELMMARLFLEEPKAIAHRFEFLMAKCFTAFHGENARNSMNNFDCIILAILEYDVRSAVQDVHALGFHWMSTHLTDLLIKSQIVAGTDDNSMEQYACSLDEYFVMQYALEVGACQGLWTIATAYFERCPRYGALSVRATIARETVTSETKTERLWGFCCGKKGLRATQRQIALRRALICKQDGASYATALQWALRGNHLDECDAIADVVLDECERKDSLTVLHEAVDFLEPQPELARTKLLAWLVKYRELSLVLEDRASLQKMIHGSSDTSPAPERDHETLQKQLQFVSKEAAKRIHALMDSSTAPRRLRVTLLMHVESLLETSPSVFTSKQLFAVMEYLRAIDRAFDRQEFYQDALNLKRHTRLQQLLSRNLSEAVITEPGMGSFSSSSSVAREKGSKSEAMPSFAMLTSRLQLLPGPAVAPPNALVEFMDHTMKED